jgi:hypothetical protein
VISELVTDNPILIKHVRSRLRRPQGTYLVITVFLVAACLMWAGHLGNILDDGPIFVMFFAIQALALHLAGTSQVASSISQSNDSGILDFHRVSPLSPSATAVGFILGAPIREYLVALLLVPFALFCALLGKPGLLGFCTTGAVLLSTTLLFHSVAMMAGLVAQPGKTRGANMGVGFLLVIATFATGLVFRGIPIPGLLTAGPALFEAMDFGGGGFPGPQTPTFFGVTLPLFVQSLIYQTPLTLFLLVAIVRRMRSGQAALYSKTTAIAFLVTVSVLNLGGIIGHQNVNPEFVVPVLLYVNWFIALALTLAVSPSQGSYRNCLRRANKLGLHRPPLWDDDSSNRGVVLALASVTFAMAQIVQTFVQANAGPQFWPRVGITLCVISYFGSAVQFFTLRFGRRSRPMLFLFLFLFWLMPLLVGSLAAAAFGNAGVGPFIAGLSPLFGIAAGSISSLVWSFVLAGVFYGLMVREERRCQDELRNATLLDFDAEV